MVYGTYNYSIHGVYEPTYNWGPHIVPLEFWYISWHFSSFHVEQLYLSKLSLDGFRGKNNT